MRDRVRNDHRRIIKVYDRFGYSGQAGVDIRVTDDYVHFQEGTSEAEQVAGRSKMGFILGFDEVESLLKELADKSTSEDTCPLDAEWKDESQRKWLKLTDFTAFGDHPQVGFLFEEQTIQAEGWLSVWFINCAPKTVVSFDISVALYNMRPDQTRYYISKGELPLPA